MISPQVNKLMCSRVAELIYLIIIIIFNMHKLPKMFVSDKSNRNK